MDNINTIDLISFSVDPYIAYDIIHKAKAFSVDKDFLKLLEPTYDKALIHSLVENGIVTSVNQMPL